MNHNIIVQHKIALDLWQISKLQLEDIKSNKGRAGARLFQMSCATMQAFTVEAVLNLIGNQIFQESWPEKTQWKEKAKLLCFQLQIELDFGVEPFCSINELMKYRNTLAHGKASATIAKTLPLDDSPPELLTEAPHWLRNISVSRLERTKKQLEIFMEILFKKSNCSWEDFYIAEEGWTN